MIYTTAIKKAVKFSIKTHEVYQKQKRKGKDIPYITHPLTVGLILMGAGASEDVVVAGILHDTIEDSVPEKKVTVEMIRERFGEKVADLVMTVTEQDKNLSWEERKKLALEHIKEFSHESLVLKSADIISNASELLDDYEKDKNAVFDRFNASKEKILKHQIEAIGAILEKWPESPLAEDLSSLAKSLWMMGAPEFMASHPAIKIEYADYDENMPLECPICHWKGTPKESGWIEHHSDLLDVSCPNCEKMLLIASYPLANK